MANPNIVNVTSIVGGNAGWLMTTSLVTVLMTATAGSLVKINSLICTNIHGTNAATVSIDINGLGTGTTGVSLTGPLATCRIASTMNVPADDSLVLIDKPIYLMELDVLQGGASAASTLELFASYEIINDA